MKENTTRFLKLYSITVLAIALIAAWMVINLKKHDLVYVNTAQVLSASSLHIQEQERMAEVMALLKKAELDASQLYKSMSEEDARKTKIVDQQLLVQFLEDSRQSIHQAVLLEVNNAVKTVIAREGYSVAVDASLVLTNDTSLDITDKIVQELAPIKVNFGPLPKINVIKSEEQ